MPENVTGVNGASAAVLIYTTFPTADVAEEIAAALVEAGLAACVNIIPGMRSIYRWQGTIQRDAEVSAFVKTRASLAMRVIGWLRVAHPYANPAAVILPVAGGSHDFLEWLVAECHA
ncbi:MAG: divalent-cation tolerance protein CutA [Hyphomicrobiaceae bacterium]